MIRCQNCRHEEYEGTLYCSACGQPLWQGQPRAEAGPDAPTTQRFAREDLAGAQAEAQAGPSPRPRAGPADPYQIALRPTGEEQPLFLAGLTEYRLGRGDPRQPVKPDVDLGPFRALELGVSRLHAVLRRTGRSVTLTDLGSTNGTTVNGVPLTPHQPQTLRDGDELRLGKLALRIFFS